MFQGLSADAYHYLWEIGLNNNIEFYQATKERYRNSLYEPLCRLADALAPTVADIDDRLSTRYSHVVSRLRRDTRFTRDKSPYRDHAWLHFRLPGVRSSECFVLYAEFERESYGYGIGMYGPQPELMQAMRERMLARPNTFLSMVSEPAFAAKFHLQGESFKRTRYQDMPEALRPYLNMRSISFCFSSPELKRTMRPELADEIIEAFEQLRPVYRFLAGLD
jgi:uncharacterized protein (TIGR02453 family)